MASYKPFTNFFRNMTSAFAAQGKTFRYAWEQIKRIEGHPSYRDTYRNFKESVIFRQQEPAFDKYPRSRIIANHLLTPTTQILRNKYQYVSRVTVRWLDERGTQTYYQSFLSSKRMSKMEAEQQMMDIFVEMAEHNNSAVFSSVEAHLAGVRKQAWID